MELKNILHELDIESYKKTLQSADSYYSQRIDMLDEARRLFQSRRQLSEMSVAERGVFLGQNSKKNNTYNFDVNLFGAPGGNGEVKSIIASKYACLDDFFSHIPRHGTISDETYFSLAELFKTAVSDAGCTKFPFVLFTRLLTVTRPDTFVSAAAGALDPLCKALNIKQVKNDLENYWNVLLPALHKKSLFQGNVGEPEGNYLALVDGVVWVENKENSATTIQEDIESYSVRNNEIVGSNIPNGLNQILFGPPGTGKTYHTIEAAVKAAEPNFNWDGDRTLLREEYERLVSEKRIRFVTFHQSYGYEEFVEGLRAITDDDGQISYRVEDGIFKQIADSARARTVQSAVTSHYNLDKRNIWKMSLGNTQTSEGEMVFNECLENNYILLGYGGDIDFSGCNSVKKIKEKFIEHGYELKPQDYHVTSVNMLINKMSIGDLVIVSDGNYKFKAIAEVTSDYQCLTDDRDWYYQKRDVRWLMTFDEPRPVNELFTCNSLSQMTLYGLKDSVISRQKLSALLNQQQSDFNECRNHVLIIDEINRGNISKILGELITLIEPSKRTGEQQDEALSLTLPYSGKAFSVPDNLYIIGTMNTADRSLAMMDTALRRRFDFVEMMPKPELLEGVIVNGINLQQLLDVLNQRIEVLYDREHTLGHAFFMPVKALLDDTKLSDEEKQVQAFEMLKSVFQNKIIPLLEEYFFEDWDKIRLVLADNQKPESLQFVTGTKLEQKALDALFGSKHGLGQFGEVQKQYSLKNKDFEVWNTALAYKGIYAPDEVKNPEPKASLENKISDEAGASQQEPETTGV